MKVYVVIQDFYSHDMILDRGGSPHVVGVFSTLKAAKLLIRPNMDDYVLECTVDSTGMKNVWTSYS